MCRATKFRDKMAAVDAWIKARRFPRTLRTSIRTYYAEVSDIPGLPHLCVTCSVSVAWSQGWVERGMQRCCHAAGQLSTLGAQQPSHLWIGACCQPGTLQLHWVSQCDLGADRHCRIGWG